MVIATNLPFTQRTTRAQLKQRGLAVLGSIQAWHKDGKMHPEFRSVSHDVHKNTRSSRQRVQARAAHVVATCAMGAWLLLGIIPVVVILYSMS